MIGFAVSVLAMRRYFCVDTLARVQNFKVVWVGLKWIDLLLTKCDYPIVCAFAFFRAYIFFNDFDGHKNLVWECLVWKTKKQGRGNARTATAKVLTLDDVDGPTDL